MATVAILGAGEIAGALAREVAASDLVSIVIRLADLASVAAGEALGSSMPGQARGWHDRGIALSREIGAVALVRAHQVG